MPTTLFAEHHHSSALGTGAGDDCDVHYIHHSKSLYIISEHDYVRSLIPSQRDVCAKGRGQSPPTRLGTPLRRHSKRKERQAPRPLMATLQYSPDVNMALGGPPGSPPDLTNSKSSKSSSFHSSVSDVMGPSDLAHFEDITLDDVHGLGPSSFPMPAASPNRVLFDAPRAMSVSSIPSRATAPHAAHHSFRDLTSNTKPRFPSLKGQVNNVMRQQQRLHAPGKKQFRRGFTSPSAPSLANLANLAAPVRRSRSPSPSSSRTFPPAPRALARKSSHNLDVSPSPSMSTRRQSWQHSARKSVKEREAECDDEDDEVPEDAIIWNVPISPRPAQERSPAPSTAPSAAPSACGSPPQASTSPATSRPTSQKGELSSAKTSPALSDRRFSTHSSPSLADKENQPPTQGLVRQRTNTWETTYTTLDADAKKLTEALEEYQTEFEKQQEIKRQQPGLSRSSSVEKPEKPKAVSLPPIRKSDPLIDPFQPSMEKQKYLSRTRPSWLPPKDPKEEKKHLKEYQRMQARIQESERLEAQRQEEEALAREQAERIKAEYWSTLLLPNWDTEMCNPELKGSHRKMWWNGIPPKLREAVWKKAIGNELEVTETTYKVALEKAQLQYKERGPAALDYRYGEILENTKAVFPDLKMFAPKTRESEEQPLHKELVNVCIAYSSYRPDVETTTAVHHIAALFLLNMTAVDSFIALSNILNRPLPLSFLIRDHTAITAAYDSTLSAVSKKNPSLATRLASLRVEPRDYLFLMFSALFCDRLSIEHAARVMDVYVVEGDKIPPRVAVGLLGILEGACMTGELDAVLQVLQNRTIRESPDEFMGKVYEAGKST